MLSSVVSLSPIAGTSTVVDTSILLSFEHQCAEVFGLTINNLTKIVGKHRAEKILHEVSAKVARYGLMLV